MRDSLSLLDQVISFTNSNLTEAEVSQVLGLTERSLVFAVFDCLTLRKAAELVSYLEKISLSGQNPGLFLEDLLKLIRHSLLLKADSKATDLIDLPVDEIQLLTEKIQNFTDGDLHMMFDMALKAAQDLHRASDAQIVFEVALLRMSQAPRIAGLKALLTSTISTTPMSSLSTSAPVSNGRTEQPRPKPFEEVTPQVAVAVDINSDRWLGLVEAIRLKDAFFAAKIENLLFLGCDQLKITLQPPQSLAFLSTQLQNSEMRQKLQGFIDSEIAQGYTFEVLKSSVSTLESSKGESASSLAIKKQELAEEKQMEKWQSDPRVQKAKEVFKGEIKFIKKTD